MSDLNEMISCCGSDCSACYCYGEMCKGCNAVCGKCSMLLKERSVPYIIAVGSGMVFIPAENVTNFRAI